MLVFIGCSLKLLDKLFKKKVRAVYKQLWSLKLSKHKDEKQFYCADIRRKELFYAFYKLVLPTSQCDGKKNKPANINHALNCLIC